MQHPSPFKQLHCAFRKEHFDLLKQKNQGWLVCKSPHVVDSRVCSLLLLQGLCWFVCSYKRLTPRKATAPSQASAEGPGHSEGQGQGGVGTDWGMIWLVISDVCAIRMCCTGLRTTLFVSDLPFSLHFSLKYPAHAYSVTHTFSFSVTHARTHTHTHTHTHRHRHKSMHSRICKHWSHNIRMFSQRQAVTFGDTSLILK